MRGEGGVRPGRKGVGTAATCPHPGVWTQSISTTTSQGQGRDVRAPRSGRARRWRRGPGRGGRRWLGFAVRARGAANALPPPPVLCSPSFRAGTGPSQSTQGLTMLSRAVDGAAGRRTAEPAGLKGVRVKRASPNPNTLAHVSVRARLEDDTT